jgi:cell division protein FtsL
MEISISGQAASFGGAVLLGMAAGLLYDMFRIMRFRAARRVFSAGLDLLFWVVVTVALFSYALVAGDGQLRIFMLLGLCIGAFLYFILLSSFMLRLGYKVADFLVFLFHFLSVPILIFWNFFKKTMEKFKNVFHYFTKWYRIKHTLCSVIKNRRRLDKDRGSEGAAEAGRFYYKDCRSGHMIYAAISLLNLRSQITAAESERDQLQQLVAEQKQVNTDLADDINNSDDPARMEEVARNKLGLVLPDEKVFYNISN